MRRLAVVASLLLAGTSCSSRHAAPGPLLAYSNGLDLVVFDPAAATRRVLVRGHLGPWETYDEDRFAVEPTWSPDGKRIAFVMKGERARIDVVDVGSGRVRRIAHAP